MKVIRTRPDNRPEIPWNEIAIGDVMEFPHNPGWAGSVFMRIYDTRHHDPSPERLSVMLLVRVSSPPDGNRRYDSAGDTYEYTRDMCDGTGTWKNKYVPVRLNASICIED